MALTRLALLAAVSAGALCVGLGPNSASAGDVTFDRLVNANSEPQNWLTNNHDYSSDRYSPLKEINRGNVRNLKFAFSLALGGMQPAGTNPNASLQATPLVDDGIMYVTDGLGAVYRIDVSSGNRAVTQWIMDPGADMSNGIPTNRGVARLGNGVFSVTMDGRLVKTNADTGEVMWDNQITEQEKAYLTVAPLAVKNMVIVGVSGADSGIRGWIDAYDADTGDRVWRRWTIPAPGEAGSETWKDTWNAWQTGGGSAWVTGSYDPDPNTLYWGVGNPAPDFDNAYRPGDNLYTNSVLAMNADTGDIKWYFQYTPNDAWDFDEVGTHILIDGKINGEDRKMIGHSARNGFYYTLDRTNGSFIGGVQFVADLNWTAGLDPKTGKPVEYEPNADQQLYAKVATQTRDNPDVNTCPSIGGGNNYFPSTYSRDTGMFYAIGNDRCNDIKLTAFDKGQFKQGDNVGFGNIKMSSPQAHASISAIDPGTGKIVKRITDDYPSYGGLLSTGGGLVFSGFLDGSLKAYDAKTLEELWSVNVGTPFNAPPITYSVNGKQYIAILAGVGRIAKGTLAGHHDTDNIKASSMMFVFSL
jgi:alcohol dehydrogenase (cytochrome c)